MLELLRRGLTEEGHNVTCAADGGEGWELAHAYEFDAIVLDVMMPKMNGFDLAKRLRQERIVTPVLMLTAKDSVPDVVRGLDAGADDYLTKPFRIEELIMRLRALVRRSAGHAAPRIVCGALAFDAQTGVFERDGLALKLTALEWRVLECLILHKDAVVERLVLADKVYEGDAGTDSNSLEVIVGRLRRKVGREAIETVRGRGYRLVCGDSR
jgi:DNA-binding response OmpR family regulator